MAAAGYISRGPRQGETSGPAGRRINSVGSKKYVTTTTSKVRINAVVCLPDGNALARNGRMALCPSARLPA